MSPRISRRRRSLNDRRSWEPTPQLPFIDGGGVLVVQDRRRIADRRIANIRVAWRVTPC